MPALRGKAAFSMTMVAGLSWNDQNMIVLGAVPDRDPKTRLYPSNWCCKLHPAVKK
jgi:hypothetical protein